MTDKNYRDMSKPCAFVTGEEMMDLVDYHHAPNRNHSFMLVTYKLWNELMKNEDNKKLVKSLQSKGDN